MTKKILIITALIIVIVLVLLVRLLRLFEPSNIVPGPSPAPFFSPSPRMIAATPRPSSLFTSGSFNKLQQKLEGENPLSQTDQEVRRSLVGSLNSSSGILFSTAEYSISYTQPFDLFEVQIKTSNVTAAKQNAVAWLEGKGLTHEGVCNLPIMFYLDQKTFKELKERGGQFNPLPEGC